MTTADETAKAYQAIGEYFCAFSEVEHELGQAVKVVLGLQKNEAIDAIVGSLDFAKKAGFVLAVIDDAKKADGSEASKEWKEQAAAAVKEAFDCNTLDRLPLAHSLLQPNKDGSVDLKRLTVDHGKVKGREGKSWTHEDFTKKILRSRGVAEKLRSLTKELREIKIEIPRGNLSWLLTTNPMLFYQRRMSPVLMQSLSEPPAQPKKA